MSRPLEIVTINGSYSSPSKTGALIDLITAEIARRLDARILSIDVSLLGPGFTNALTREELPADTLGLIERLERADFVVAGTPVFRGSYSGLFKHFVDFVDQYALANKPVMLVATGGSERHALVIEHLLRPLFGFFQAAIVPVGIYAASGDFDGTTVLNPEVYARIEMAINDISDILTKTAPQTATAHD